jgi:hypothetical protein
VLYPKKNLIKPLTSSDWAISQHATVLGPYHLKVNQPVQYQASVLSKLDLKPNTLYTLSCEGITENAQFYVKRVLNGAAAYHILKKGVEVLEFTAVAGATYTIEFHNGTVLGEGYVLNFQLEEGKKTPFAPYELANKKAIMPIETINSDMSGAASHVYPYGNIIQVKEDVRLWGYKIQVGTPTGTFDSVIYEWNNGAIGEPLFREVVNASTSGVMNLSYRGTLLKAGKKYYIGRNDPNRDNSSTGNAGVFRKTAMPPAEFKYISTLGGSQFYSPAIDFPSTWYYIFALEIESAKNKPAATFAKKNLIPPFSKWNKTDAYTINSDYKITGVFTSGVIKSCDITVNVEVGKTYTLSGKVSPLSGRIRVGRKSDNGLIGVVGANGSAICTFKATEPQYIISLDNNYGQPVFGGTVVFEELQLEEGTAQTPFQPFEPINKPLSFFPRKSLIPDFNDSRWFADTSTTGGTMAVDPIDPYKMKLTTTVSAQGRLIHIPVEVGKTYTFSFGKMEGLYRLYKRKVTVHDVAMNLVQNAGAGLPTSFTFTPDADYQGFVTLRLTSSWAGTMAFEQLKLEEGPDKTPFQLYVNNMKPAVLYPQLNLIKPFSKWDSLAAEMVVTSDYKAKMSPTQAAKYSFVTFNVKSNTTYTVKANHNGRLGIYKGGSTAIRAYGAEQTFTFNSGVYDQLSLYFNNASAGDYYIEDVMLYEGTTDEKFEPYKLGNKK